MALQSWGHSHYWAGTGGGGAPGNSARRPRHYPAWQASVILPSMGGACQAAWDWLTTWLKGR